MKSLITRSMVTIRLISNRNAVARTAFEKAGQEDAAPSECLRVYPGLAGDTTKPGLLPACAGQTSYAGRGAPQTSCLQGESHEAGRRVVFLCLDGERFAPIFGRVGVEARKTR